MVGVVFRDNVCNVGKVVSPAVGIHYAVSPGALRTVLEDGMDSIVANNSKKDADKSKDLFSACFMSTNSFLQVCPRWLIYDPFIRSQEGMNDLHDRKAQVESVPMA
ncbi:hypothetical protein JTE90_006735 [Oedothorax gibbosus]|uniref:Uncharacterized protein n=1 Tax=Oedothorax gibbosus TaxID=931172 RepID=A0AAV6U9B7_9ARAC|nr:hypothetical protein JTE90_006735 [Oedothorax gibbosus]